MNRPLATAVVFLIALATSYGAWGAPAGDQNGESFALGIYGNANMDDSIDDKDIAYVEGVINGTNAATNLSRCQFRWQGRLKRSRSNQANHRRQ